MNICIQTMRMQKIWILRIVKFELSTKQIEMAPQCENVLLTVRGLTKKLRDISR